MYFAAVGLFLLVLPLVSCGIELAQPNHAPALVIATKWFVFSGVGMRLSTAGLRQIFNPRYTAETILGIKGDDALLLVRELGFANVAIGAMGIASLAFTGWVTPALVVGAIFYGLAGVNHTLQAHRTTHENVAMISDILFAILLTVLGVTGTMT
jgi:hypothetical protein